MYIFNSNLDKLKYGKEMFATFQVGPEDGYGLSMEFISDLPNLIDGTGMFYDTGLLKFETKDGNKVNLKNLEIGDDMFTVYTPDSHNSDMLFSIDMPRLKSANMMFYSDNRYDGSRVYTGNLDSLESAWDMFGCYLGYNDGGNCKEFYSDLPKLKNGSGMVPAGRIFRGSLPSLVNGYKMFNSISVKCCLDALSVLCIVSSIPDRTGLINTDGYPNRWDSESGKYVYDETIGGYIDIGIDCANTEEAKNAFVQEIDYDSWDEMIQEFTDKNWVVRFSFNPQTSSYGMRNIGIEEQPIFVKIEEAEENKSKRELRRYRYTSQDGTKHYNIHWYHTSNGNNDGYTQFNSLQEAIEHFGLKEKETTE